MTDERKILSDAVQTTRSQATAAPHPSLLAQCRLPPRGKAIIGYEGKDYELNAGESFRFDKNGLHSVTPQGKFKMSLLLVIE